MKACAGLGSLLLATCLCLAAGGARLRGDTGAHDPSRVVRCKDRYWVFFTGPLGPSKWSADGLTWNAGPPVFQRSLPEWVAAILPDKKDTWVWAPDLLLVDDRYCLYYSVSALFGRNESAIGLATNPTLDPADARYRWTDHGPVIVSVIRANPDRGVKGNWEQHDPALRNDGFNAIDAGPVLAGDQLWLSFGSFWSGIHLLPLDRKTGKRAPGDARLTPIADYDGDRDRHHAIEAPYLHRHGDYYYLFVNWDYCCRGVNSTYNLRVGRSRSATGPYLDRDGVDLRRGGGSAFLATMGEEVGPGHAGIYPGEAESWFSYHFYDGAERGRPTLGIRQLSWDAAGWPVAGAALGPK
jgi:arabinan endo-1,5-alpha-L-arabinosidase